MKFDGIECQRVRHIGFRDSKEGDLDCDGEQIAKHYCVFVYIKQCRTYEEDGRKYYDSSEAPNIPADNGATNYAYGKTRKRSSGWKYLWIAYERKWVYVPFLDYYTTPYYVAYDGVVYRGTIRNPCSVSYWRQQGLDHEDAREKYNEEKTKMELYVKEYLDEKATA